MRNVTGDPWAGVAADEVFDPTPYAGAYVRYFVRHPTTQLMPRKIKTSFTGSDKDRAISGIHDVAFLSRERDGVKGFEIRVGGGTSIMARVAPTLYDFVEADNGDYIKVAEAALRIFDRQEWLRVNRARARIKVLVYKIGIDAFREQVDAELEGDWVGERDFDVERLRFDDEEEENAPEAPATPASPNGDRSEFDRFLQGNVQPQRQEGFASVEVKIERGDLTPAQFRGLAAIMRETPAATRAAPCSRTSFCAGCATRRCTRSGSGEGPGSGRGRRARITDTVRCPGTDSCKLGITSSIGLDRAIKQRIEGMQIDDPLTRRIHVEISGFPNGSASVTSPTSASRRLAGSRRRQMPAYMPHIGGNYEGREVVFGTRLKARLPAKQVPEAVQRWIELYEGERTEGEEFNAFAERAGAGRFEAAIKDLTLPAEFSLETMQQFIDWTRSSPYKVERGEGECAI